MKKIILVSLVFASMLLGTNSLFAKVYKPNVEEKTISLGSHYCIHDSGIPKSVSSGPFISFRETKSNFFFTIEDEVTGDKSEISIPKRSFTCIIKRKL